MVVNDDSPTLEEGGKRPTTKVIGGTPTQEQEGVKRHSNKVTGGTPTREQGRVKHDLSTKVFGDGPTHNQGIYNRTPKVVVGTTTLETGGKGHSLEVTGSSPTLEKGAQTGTTNVMDLNVTDHKWYEGAQSVVETELGRQVPHIETTPVQHNPPAHPSSPTRSPPAPSNLSPSQYSNPPDPSHPPQVYNPPPPAFPSPFAISHPLPAHSSPSTYSQPPSHYSQPPIPYFNPLYPQTPLCYPYQQPNTHNLHPHQFYQPQYPHGNIGYLPQQPCRPHECGQVFNTFNGNIQGASVFAGSGMSPQTPANAMPGPNQPIKTADEKHGTGLLRRENMAEMERAESTKIIVLLETDQGMTDSSLYALCSHIQVLMNYPPNLPKATCDLDDLLVLGKVECIKFYVAVKNSSGANKMLKLNGTHLFGVTLQASLSDRVHEDAVSVVPL